MLFTSNARTQGMTPKLVKANALLREVHRIVMTKGSLQTLLSFFIFLYRYLFRFSLRLLSLGNNGWSAICSASCKIFTKRSPLFAHWCGSCIISDVEIFEMFPGLLKQMPS